MSLFQAEWGLTPPRGGGDVDNMQARLLLNHTQYLFISFHCDQCARPSHWTWIPKSPMLVWTNLMRRRDSLHAHAWELMFQWQSTKSTPNCFHLFSFACGQGQDNGKVWIPYHIRVRSFFERWPGAMKAWKLGVISLAWMLLYSWEALPESPQDAAAEIEAEASKVPGFGVLAPDWELLSFVACQLSYASPLKPFFRRTKRMWLKFMILQPNKLCFVNSTGRCVVCLQAIWIHFLWVRFISISSS